MRKVGRVNTLISPATYSICYAKSSGTFAGTNAGDKESILATVRTIRALLCPGTPSLNA
jgi:hypothetical protein